MRGHETISPDFPCAMNTDNVTHVVVVAGVSADGGEFDTFKVLPKAVDVEEETLQHELFSNE